MFCSQCSTVEVLLKTKWSGSADITQIIHFNPDSWVQETNSQEFTNHNMAREETTACIYDNQTHALYTHDAIYQKVYQKTYHLLGSKQNGYIYESEMRAEVLNSNLQAGSFWNLVC